MNREHGRGSTKGRNYALLLNPHNETRLSTCPRCRKLTHPRKFALVIGIAGIEPYVQGKTCKFCSKCSMVLVQQDELEFEIADAMRRRGVEAGGKRYDLIGVLAMRFFKQGLEGTVAAGTLEKTSIFRRPFGLSYQPGGWYREGHEPPARPATREQRVPE